VLFVGVFCGSDLSAGVCVCVCVCCIVHCLGICPYHILLDCACESAGCTCVVCCV